ncbi:MAG TPA: hypothetical protein VML19_26260 [Verrucomicrobiae bacterium]|nr:hypothetical protein [Verrucomicrobiae bacterium]
MMQTVQLSITDGAYEAAIREALSRSCAWRIETVDRPDPNHRCVLVLDESAFDKLPLPFAHPERIVLIAGRDPQKLAEAWEAGIVSVISAEDPMNTVLLAIMAAALRVARFDSPAATSGGISPNPSSGSASISPEKQNSRLKSIKYQ